MKKFYVTRARTISIVLAIVISLLCDVTFAANGKITGRVIDSQTKEPLPAVNVVIIGSVLSDGTQVPLDHPMGAATNADGYYFILNVTPGTYAVRASIVGYTAITQTDVNVDLDRTVTVNFDLSPATIQVSQVVVTAKREIIKPDVSSTQEVIETKRLTEMPVTRMDEFLGTVKGIQVVSGSEGNGLSVRGGAIRQTDIRLDGLSLRDPRTDNSYLALNTTTIKEIQVLTGGFEAKYGGIQSGLLNVVTKDGQRDRYTVSLSVDMAPSGQKRYFGSDPYSNDSWVYQVYAGKYAMQGVPAGDTTVPVEFRSFKGWANAATPERALDSTQKLELWKAQHPQYNYGNVPDMYVEGSITGPLPGASIPFFGDYAKNTTFLLGVKYENSQLAFPVGPRNNYVDWNTQLKLTTTFPNNMRLSINGMYAKINSESGGATTSYGGALVGSAQSFSYFNSTPSSVSQQASLLGGNGFSQMFNRSRLQYYTQKYIVGGAKLTQPVSNNAFYTLDFQAGYTDQSLNPFAMDTSVGSHYVEFYSEKAKKTYRYNVPDYGSPNASTNFGYDVLNTFAMYGGVQRVDSSYSMVYRFKGDMTAQLGRHHQVEAGFSAQLQDMFVYSGTWFQSQLSYTPDTWQYYKATPLQLGLYAQDKLEFEGMVLNIGLRLDYLNPFKKGYNVSFPLSDSYQQLLNDIYQNLPGPAGQYQRWEEFRALLDNPPGWPTTEDQAQLYLSPRLGVSFPITESSKMYFNYGHFYQNPPVSFLYNTYLSQGGVAVPTPGLKMGETISYEFGYEQMFLQNFLVNITAYYKDERNQPLQRTYINYYHDNTVTEYVPDRFGDIRGVELRLERNMGEFVTFNAMYDYMLQSTGQYGLAAVYENQLEARNSELRSPNVNHVQPIPRANINLNLHTPQKFGPKIWGGYPLSKFYANIFFRWQSGGQMLLNPEEPDVKLRNYVDIVNTWNIDLRASKSFSTSFGDLEFVLTVKNLTDNKWLNTANMTQAQYSEYKQSLRTPDKGGSDKWGQYKSDDNHIKVGWWTAPIFLNPRRILLGVRFNL